MSTSQRDAPAAGTVRLDPGGAAASRVAERRAARRADNRTDILDAAERVFAEYGIEGGSIRKIGADSGFSAAAVYTFFESKQQLVKETLARRGEELLQGMRAIAAREPEPLNGLHENIDVTIAFFDARPYFGQLLRHMRGGVELAGSALSELESSDFALFLEAREIIAGFIRAGQVAGEIRSGHVDALAHLYEVLINEYVNSSDGTGRLTPGELHAFIGGALRNA